MGQELEGGRRDDDFIVISLTPDVCLTPSGSGMAPVAYSILARFNAMERTSPNVNFVQVPAATSNSRIPKVQGDEPGTGGGVVSGKNVGYCKPVENMSGTVKINGYPVVRHDTLFDMNAASPESTGNTQGRTVYPTVVPVALVDADGNIVANAEITQIRNENADGSVNEIYEVRDENGNLLQRSGIIQNADGSKQSAFQVFDKQGNLLNEGHGTVTAQGLSQQWTSQYGADGSLLGQSYNESFGNQFRSVTQGFNEQGEFVTNFSQSGIGDLPPGFDGNQFMDLGNGFGDSPTGDLNLGNMVYDPEFGTWNFEGGNPPLEGGGLPTFGDEITVTAPDPGVPPSSPPNSGLPPLNNGFPSSPTLGTLDPGIPAGNPMDPPVTPETTAEGGVWDAASPWVHGTLDGIGLIPGLGEIADGINALIYLGEGNMVDAGLSAGSMIPFAGWGATIGKYGRKIKKWMDSPAFDAAVDGAKALGRKVGEAYDKGKELVSKGVDKVKDLASKGMESAKEGWQKLKDRLFGRKKPDTPDGGPGKKPGDEDGVTVKGKKISQAMYDDLAQQATQNKDAKEVVLGKYDRDNRALSYENVAKNHADGDGATYFHLENWDEVTQQVGAENMWNINESFLRQQFEAGKDFLFSHDPNAATGYFLKEVDYLKDLGFDFVQDGNLWRAVLGGG